MSELVSQLMPYIVSTLAAALTAIASYVGVRIKAIIEEKANTEIKKKVIQDVCKFVEQIYVDLHGQDKLDKAVEVSTQLLNEKGITVTELELRVLIEATVHGFKDAVQ